MYVLEPGFLAPVRLALFQLLVLVPRLAVCSKTPFFNCSLVNGAKELIFHFFITIVLAITLLLTNIIVTVKTCYIYKTVVNVIISIYHFSFFSYLYVIYEVCKY